MNAKVLIGGALLLIGGLLVGGNILGNNGNGGGVGGHGQANVGNAGGAGNTVLPEQITSESMPKLGGGTIALADYQGEKPVILDFFATWCPNCRRDMPKLNKWYEKYKDDVEVIGINLQENEGVVQNYISSQGISFPIAMDSSGRISRSFQIQYTNTHVLIDESGAVVRVVPGDIRESDITALIKS